MAQKTETEMVQKMEAEMEQKTETEMVKKMDASMEMTTDSGQEMVQKLEEG
jgi:hypothetical protein